MPGLMDDPSWQNFGGDTTRVCLQCGYRWPIEDRKSPTETPGCPECGFASADILTECKAPDWDMDEEIGQDVERFPLHRKDAGRGSWRFWFVPRIPSQKTTEELVRRVDRGRQGPS